MAEFAPAFHGLGEDASSEAAAMACDVVLNGIAGAAGLRPTLAALGAGNVLALANKESLIIGGPLVTRLAAPGQIVPVDSEHSALAQALRSGSRGEVRRLILTASGGPFRGWDTERLRTVAPQQALAHPTWDMGPLVTINSATLVNKGLELIEAHLLFDMPLDRIDVVVHPQSVIHSMVEFVDGSTIAQASPPDMRLPIALGLGWPDRVPDAAAACDWTRRAEWSFEPVDHETFPAVRLAARVAEAGGVLPAVFNAADEVAVDAFHEGRFGSRTSIPRFRRSWTPTTYHRGSTSPWTTSSRPTPGRARRRRPDLPTLVMATPADGGLAPRAHAAHPHRAPIRGGSGLGLRDPLERHRKQGPRDQESCRSTPDTASPMPGCSILGQDRSRPSRSTRTSGATSAGSPAAPRPVFHPSTRSPSTSPPSGIWAASPAPR